MLLFFSCFISARTTRPPIRRHDSDILGKPNRADKYRYKVNVYDRSLLCANLNAMCVCGPIFAHTASRHSSSIMLSRLVCVFLISFTHKYLPYTIHRTRTRTWHAWVRLRKVRQTDDTTTTPAAAAATDRRRRRATD